MLIVTPDQILSTVCSLLILMQGDQILAVNALTVISLFVSG